MLTVFDDLVDFKLLNASSLSPVGVKEFLDITLKTIYVQILLLFLHLRSFFFFVKIKINSKRNTEVYNYFVTIVAFFFFSILENFGLFLYQ